MNKIKKLIRAAKFKWLPVHSVIVCADKSNLVTDWVDFVASIYVREKMTRMATMMGLQRGYKTYEDLFAKHMAPEVANLLERFPDHRFHVIIDQRNVVSNVRVQFDFLSADDAMTFRLMLP